MTAFALLFSACAVKIDIEYKDNLTAYQPSNIEQMPINAAIILAEENDKNVKTRDPGTGIKEIYTFDSGKVLNAAIKQVTPNFFKQYSYTPYGETPSAGDIQIKTNIESFEVDFRGGFSKCFISLNLMMKTVFMTSDGRLLADKSTHSGWEESEYNCFSTDGYNKSLSIAASKGAHKGLEDIYKSINTSRSISEYISSLSSTTPAPVPAPAVSSVPKAEKIGDDWKSQEPPNDETAKKRIRLAFEKGYIDA